MLSTDSIQKNIRIRYIVALSAIAILVTCSAIGIQFLLNQQRGDAEIINIAGMQRMLSQKIALNVLRIQTAEVSAPIAVSPIRSNLLAAVDRFEQNHWFLVKEDDPETRHRHLSEQLMLLYYSDSSGANSSLHSRVLNYINEARRASRNEPFNRQLFLPFSV